MEKLLEVKNLSVSFDTYAGEVQAVRDISFDVGKGECVAIVGESGCGKSVTSKSIIRLNPSPPSRIKEESSIKFKGKELTTLSKKDIRKIRGQEIGMIFQDPMTSLNPTMTIGYQICEGFMKHQGMRKKEAIEHAVKMLELVGIPDPQKIAKKYPHQLSGGMKQRVIIAIALSGSPELLIADEPTTALDVTIQAQILALMKDLQKKMGMSIILITHDLGVVAGMAQKVIVVYGGKIMEIGTLDDLFYNPQHPYTWGLLNSIARLDLEDNAMLEPIMGTPPDLLNPPKGCPFASRCSYVLEVCKHVMPSYTDVNTEHKVACWLQDPRAPRVEKLSREVNAV
ncbi:ABC transporter ATP-binding protein [Brassicibacter mesophilus]|uniref:ABC transporter ATP-binding protein n=1 Tax=Brassicibacter mesophilus TaxID=745119 RepID=UPI003D21BA82